MSLQWIKVNSSLTMSHDSKGYEYRVRESFDGDYIAIQERRSGREQTRRERAATPGHAFDLCEQWDREVR